MSSYVTYPKFEKAMNKFRLVHDKYLSIFGENSLDYVTLWNPLGIQHYPEEIDSATEMLQKAIDNNIPIENIKPEISPIY